MSGHSASTPLEEDLAISLVAVRTGYRDCARRQVIDIDARALPLEWFKRSPDYRAIRRALEDGKTIPGAKLTNEVEYVLRKPRTEGESNGITQS